MPLKLVPGFPAACHVLRCPERITNGCGVLKKPDHLVVSLLDSYGLPASVVVPGGRNWPGWPVRLPTLSLSALGHDIVRVDTQDPAAAWTVDLGLAQVILKMPLQRLLLSPEGWAEHGHVVPTELRMELLERTSPVVASGEDDGDDVWEPVAAPMTLRGGAVTERPMAHSLPEEPPVLVPSEQPASVHVFLADDSNAELSPGAAAGPLRRWTLRCPAGECASGVCIEVHSEDGKIIAPSDPKLALIIHTPSVSARSTARRNAQGQVLSGLVAPSRASADPAEASFEVQYDKKQVPGLAFLIQVLALPREAARWAVAAAVVGDGAVPARIALHVWRLDSSGDTVVNPLADPAAELPDVAVAVEDGRNMAVAWAEAEPPELLQDTAALVQLRGRADVTYASPRLC